VSNAHPGNGFFGWLGRQIGHVKKAVQTDVEKPAPKVVYRENRTEEQQLPDRPGVKFRRTVIDEVIVEPQPALPDHVNDNAGGEIQNSGAETRNSKPEIRNKSQ
jgi:hypothetical protein